MTDQLPIANPVGSPAHHGLGPVASDWDAAEVWLRAIASRGRRNSMQTVVTYGYHLRKLRWFCEHVHGVHPSRWSAQDVEAFHSFLADLPQRALCARAPGSEIFASPGDPGYTPFRKAPSASSRSDIIRCVHAMFRAWREMGYIAINPMGLQGAGSVRKVNTERSITSGLYDTVLDAMEEKPKSSLRQRQAYVRDRFILIALRELGLRASELVKANMSAFYQLSDPSDQRTYWIMQVREETAKGSRERKVPASRTVMDALGLYRQAFGLPAIPDAGDETALVLSTQIDRAGIVRGSDYLKGVSGARVNQPWKAVRTRQGLYAIVKERLAAAAESLERGGATADAERLRQASPHWLRHTFAKAALLVGQDIRVVAALLGHRELSTVMVYTEQDALDLIRSTNAVAPDLLASQALLVPRG